MEGFRDNGAEAKRCRCVTARHKVPDNVQEMSLVEGNWSMLRLAFT